MLTDDKQITTPGYWDRIYSGKNDNAKVDASNTTRPANTFDRFGWVAQYAEGPNVLDIGSGHAHICKRIKFAHPDWHVLASDQSRQAKNVANYDQYLVMSTKELYGFCAAKSFNTIIITQALEYIEDQEEFVREAKRISHHLLLTVPLGEMAKWSQLRIYTEENVKQLLEPYGEIMVFDRQGDLLLVKLKFNV